MSTKGEIFTSAMAPIKVTYFCTIRESCRRTFPRYIDWADHEKDYHTRVPRVFYCNSVDGCKEAFYNEKAFRRHFEEMHPARSLVADDYLLDPLCKRFWCGFCKKVVRAPEYSVYSEFYRACHIETHLQGGNVDGGDYQVARRADDWIYLKARK